MEGGGIYTESDIYRKTHIYIYIYKEGVQGGLNLVEESWVLPQRDEASW